MSIDSLIWWAAFSNLANAASMIVLTWWAARSRDALAFRVTAMLLVIVPILVAAPMTFYMRSPPHWYLGFVLAMTVARGVFAIAWAILSRDSSSLRIGAVAVGTFLLASQWDNAQMLFWLVVMSQTHSG